MTSADLPWKQPLSWLWSMLVGGLAVQVVGCIIAFANLPRTKLDPTGPIQTAGDPTLILAGVLGLGLGGVLSLIAVIGFGVLLGLRAHASD
ncbi:hypothetical protein [Aeromicrobium sp. CTD01-1L150]|uniref:hypothetical protein n=1 Tax=Aeromicrobium sp. CTD01-1L150 TaxID=3341830 RepID=UPI0035BF4136